MKGFAFFDLDHTLLPFDTQALFCNFVLQRARWRTAWHLAFLPYGLLRGLGLVPTATAKRAFMSHLTGMRRETLQAHAREFAGQVVKPAVYPVMLGEIERHRAAGRILVLNTASPDFYAGEIARVLGFDHCIATRVELFAALPFLPRIIGRNNKRGVKIARMREEIPEFAAATREDLGESWSYSDSAADLPLLEVAGHAVLVHPDASLEALGRARGWQVLRPERPYRGRAGDWWGALRQAVGVWRAPR